ncbi:hypothetical protein C8R46DRAFT_1042291 [Mycena filopes]|nr:hypothetical protein C8R46DRAFT_1042291 [Mycena filopes]
MNPDAALQALCSTAVSKVKHGSLVDVAECGGQRREDPIVPSLRHHKTLHRLGGLLRRDSRIYFGLWGTGGSLVCSRRFPGHRAMGLHENEPKSAAQTRADPEPVANPEQKAASGVRLIEGAFGSFGCGEGMAEVRKVLYYWFSLLVEGKYGVAWVHVILDSGEVVVRDAKMGISVGPNHRSGGTVVICHIEWSLVPGYSWSRLGNIHAAVCAAMV